MRGLKYGAAGYELRTAIQDLFFSSGRRVSGKEQREGFFGMILSRLIRIGKERFGTA